MELLFVDDNDTHLIDKFYDDQDLIYERMIRAREQQNNSIERKQQNNNKIYYESIKNKKVLNLTIKEKYFLINRFINDIYPKE